MDKLEYIQYKKQGWRDKEIADKNFISTRTLDRWKRKENIHLGINQRKRAI